VLDFAIKMDVLLLENFETTRTKFDCEERM
jgi:hypothetical protein